MKVLITKYKNKWKNDILRSFFYLINELINIHNFHLLDISDIQVNSNNKISDYFKNPSSILVFEDHDGILINEYFSDFFSGNYHKAIFTDDFHKGYEKKIIYNYYSNFDSIFTTYYHPFLKQYNTDKKKVFWTPHMYHEDSIINFNLNPVNKIFISGAISKIYEMRILFKEFYKKNKDKTAYLQHPKYRQFNYNSTKYIIGKEYSKKLNNFIACFTDCSTFSYIVSKYFEIPASGSLLLCQDPKDYGVDNDSLSELGFIDNETCIICNKENYKEKVEYILNEANKIEIDRIRINGMNMVLQNHSVSKRAQYISNLLV